MNVTEYLKKTYDKASIHLVRKRIVCNDGFSISVQGGTIFHYCKPRVNANVYLQVECGFPSEAESLLNRYAEDTSNLTDTVYPYVPIHLIERVILKHKGINVEKTLKQEDQNESN